MKTAIISVDGHVKGSRQAYRPYVPKKFLDTYDEQVKAAEEAGMRDAGNMHPQFDPEVQWNSDVRIANLESVGVVAEVLFSNGQPFQMNRLDDFANAANAELGEAGRQIYNNWLVDFVALAPERRKGQLGVSFDDVDAAVKEIHWAKEKGLGGIRLPGLTRDSKFFFDEALDPIWAACVETDFVVSQHGGAGDPNQPMGSQAGGMFGSGPGFGAFLMIATENAFFSNRSLWMMIAGGVFDRFPDLKAAWIETQVHFMVPTIQYLDQVSKSDWLGQLDLKPTLKRLPSEYFGTNIRVGVSPFTPRADPGADVLGILDGVEKSEFHLGPDLAMWGTDYPHFETNYLQSWGELAGLTTSGVSDEDIHKIVFGNAAELYGFDVDALQPHIDRVGFDIDDVRAHADEHVASMQPVINLIKDGGGMGGLFGARRAAAAATATK